MYELLNFNSQTTQNAEQTSNIQISTDPDPQNIFRSKF